MCLSVAGGLRNDPFSAFPTASNSKEVMHMVDYYIHVWSPHKSGAFDISIGFNANIDLCWPVALQDNMLFDATIAVARVAYCLSVNIPPADDEFMLYHRGTALARLRKRVSARAASDEEVVFTIARMLSISYMSGDLETWDIHFRAYREAAERYIDSKSETGITKVIAHRLRSWKALHEFRIGLNPLRDESVSAVGGLAYPEAVSCDKEPPTVTRMLPDLKELAMTGCVSSEVIEIASTINDAVNSEADKHNELELWVASGSSTRLCARLMTTVIENDLMDKELMLCCSLIALCLQLHHLFYTRPSAEEPRRPFSPPKPKSSIALRKLAQAFINKTFTLNIDLQRRLFIWASLVLGSVLLHYDDLRVKGHIILVNLATKLRPTLPGSEITHTADWMSIKQIMQGFIYHDYLADQWRACWKHSMQIQEEWEEHGLLKFGTPERPNGHGVDIVEYMVLRDARDSLPIIRKILVH